MVLGLALSFTSYDVLTPPEWVGWRNYADLRLDPVFKRSVWNTLLYTLGTVPTGMALSLGFAILVNRNLPAFGLFRTVYYIPVVTPMVAAAVAWAWLYDPTIGFLNYLLNKLGSPGLPWLTDPRWAMPSIILMSLWKGFGYNMVIFLAGLQGIPRELYEAAATDGATRVRQLWHITLPLLRPTTLYVLVTSIIGSFQVFSQVYVMTQGGPNNSTTTIVHQIYQNAFVYMDMGYAAAMAVLLFAILVVLSGASFRLLGERGLYV